MKGRSQIVTTTRNGARFKDTRLRLLAQSRRQRKSRCVRALGKPTPPPIGNWKFQSALWSASLCATHVHAHAKRLKREMAVKQNNSEAGDNASDNAGGAGNGIPPNAKPMSANGMANAEENVLPKGMDTGSPAGESLNSNRSGKRDIKALLAYLQSIDMPEQGHNVMAICERVIVDLARLQIPRGASCPRLKEDVCQVGAFLATRNEKFHQMFYLRVVYELITKSPFEPPPSCAVAIVFQLFDSTQILEAVHSLLEQNVQDSSIKKTVNLLCDWITYCTFCSTLNLWVLALLKGLRDQGKMALLDEIAMDNIEKLFHVMIFPALRQKAAPVVFHMLSTINQTPEVFHKVNTSLKH